jgi:hypothetical protein
MWNKLYTRAPKWTPYKLLLWLERKAWAEYEQEHYGCELCDYDGEPK